MSVTNKEILKQIEELRGKMPNGELTLLKKSVEDLQLDHKELRDSIRDLKKSLLDPDNGVVVRVNKNSEFRREREDSSEKLSTLFEQVSNLIQWKNSLNLKMDKNKKYIKCPECKKNVLSCNCSSNYEYVLYLLIRMFKNAIDREI